jgi:thioredoxin reductase
LNGEELTSRKVLLAIGRRGSPRKLNIPGEEGSNVAYRLLEPELIQGKNIVVVGGGDSAIESALLLADQNKVTLSYRSEVFGRLKPKNNEKIRAAISTQKVNVLFNSVLTLIEDHQVKMSVKERQGELVLKNDLVFIFAGGELPTQFLEKIGIRITKKFGEAILKHEK